MYLPSQLSASRSPAAPADPRHANENKKFGLVVAQDDQPETKSRPSIRRTEGRRIQVEERFELTIATARIKDQRQVVGPVMSTLKGLSIGLALDAGRTQTDRPRRRTDPPPSTGRQGLSPKEQVSEKYV